LRPFVANLANIASPTVRLARQITFDFTFCFKATVDKHFAERARVGRAHEIKNRICTALAPVVKFK